MKIFKKNFEVSDFSTEFSSRTETDTSLHKRKEKNLSLLSRSIALKQKLHTLISSASGNTAKHLWLEEESEQVELSTSREVHESIKIQFGVKFEFFLKEVVSH